MRFSNISVLRTIAVVVVVAYHLGAPWAKSGYLGVTVFFCISGYLVTLGFQRSTSAGAYLLQRTYRLLPALLALFLICVVLVNLWPTKLAPNTFTELTCSAVFAENMCLLWNAGYFSSDAKMIPVTHLWSLALEVQFYLLLYLLFRWLPKSKLSAVIAGILILSLVCDISYSRLNLFRSYLFAPSRLWEFLAGCLVALRSPHTVYWGKYRIPLTLFTTIAFSLALLSQFFYGTYLAGKATAVLLSLIVIQYWKDMVPVRIAEFLGEHSYAIYLAHFPAIVAIGFLCKPGQELALFPAFFALFWMLIYLADTNRNFLSKTRQHAAVPVMILAQVALTLLASQSIFKAKEVKAFEAIGFENAAYGHWRYGECFIEQSTSPFAFGKKCLEGKRALLVGDSHAAHLLPVLEGIGLDPRDISQLNVGGCLIDLHAETQSSCSRLIAENVAAMKDRPAIAFLGARFSDIPERDMEAQLERSIAFLKEQGIKNVFVIGNVPYFHPTAPFLFWKAGKVMDDAMYVDSEIIRDKLQVNKMVAQHVERAAIRQGATFIDLAGLFCDDARCNIGDRVINELYFSDYDHLTLSGAKYVGKRIAAQRLIDLREP